MGLSCLPGGMARGTFVCLELGLLDEVGDAAGHAVDHCHCFGASGYLFIGPAHCQLGYKINTIRGAY